MYLNVKFFMYLVSLFFYSNETIDINLPEYQYIADHLTEEECHLLVAALHFQSFDLPKEINSAERRLPDDVPCIDLLLHWNSSPREGKGQTHVEVCHRLNQIGREDLSNWLSKTVFHQITKDLKLNIYSSETESTIRHFNTTDTYPDEEICDEVPWWTLDSVLTFFVALGIVTLSIGTIFLCYLFLMNRFKNKHKGYKKLSTNED